jgi:hypothetical protein
MFPDIADRPTGASPRPPSYRFYWMALAFAVGALVSLVAVHGVRSGKGLMDAWLLVMLLCLVALAISLPMLVPRWARRRAARVAVVSALGVAISFVGFGFAHDEYQARMAARQSSAQPGAHGGALPGASAVEDERASQ